MLKTTMMKTNNKKVYLFDYTKDKEKTTKKSIPVGIHHIQILDRSGSMYGDIEQLVEDCKKTITQMSNDDFYTVIWFSSANQFRTLLKGIKNDEANRKASFKLLDSIKSTLGCTCFSQSVEETEKIVDELEALCPNFSVTLFTDGEAVTPWNETEEYNRVSMILQRIKDKIIAFNTIGYGNYCNEKVLTEWAQITDFGEFVHSNKIDEYHTIFEENTAKVKDLEIGNIEIEVPNKKIYYLSGNSANIFNEKVSLKHVDKKKNSFVVVADENEDISVTFNGENVDLSNAKNILKTRVQALWYKMAYAEYICGDPYNGLTILANNVKDKNFVDQQTAAFTPDEISAYKKALKKAAFRNEGRNPNTAPDNYIPDPNAPCIMDLLSILAQSKDNLYVVPNNYKRIGRKTNDSFNMFKKDSDYNTVPIENITFNEKRLNISIGFEIKGHVMLNPKQAQKVNLDSDFPCKIFRNHTIVKDGCLNMEMLHVLVNERTRDDIMSKFEDAVESITGDHYKTDIVINLTKIPIVNSSMGNATIERVFELVNLENQYKAELKICKELNKDVKPIEYTVYTDEQCELLAEYGIKNGIYNGINNSVKSVQDCDFYMGKVFEVNLKGFSKLSPLKIEDGKLTITKPANGDAFMVEYLKDTSKYDIAYMQYVKAKLTETRSKLAGIRIAKILCGKWFDQSKLKETNKPEVMTFTAGNTLLERDLTMNVKRTVEKCYFD